MDARVEATQEQLPDALSKSPAGPHGLAGHVWPASAKRGGLISLVTFSLATQRESDSRAEGARKLFSFALKNPKRATPTPRQQLEDTGFQRSLE
jgi:hypothetical protein